MHTSDCLCFRERLRWLASVSVENHATFINGLSRRRISHDCSSHMILANAASFVNLHIKENSVGSWSEIHPAEFLFVAFCRGEKTLLKYQQIRPLNVVTSILTVGFTCLLTATNSSHKYTYNIQQFYENRVGVTICLRPENIAP
jgi:hypothetical protein